MAATSHDTHSVTNYRSISTLERGRSCEIIVTSIEIDNNFLVGFDITLSIVKPDCFVRKDFCDCLLYLQDIKNCEKYSETFVLKVSEVNFTKTSEVAVKITGKSFAVKKISDGYEYKSIRISKMYNEMVPVKAETFSNVAAKSPMSKCIKNVLRRACVENRLTVGLLSAVRYLSKNCTGTIFCLTAEAPPGDSARHLQEVLLQAFCAENDIYVIKVDSNEKLASLLGCRSSTMDFSCVLIHSPYADPFTDCQHNDLSMSALTDAEKNLISYCHGFDSQPPVIKLPEK